MKYKLKEIFDLHMGKTPSRNNAEYWNSNEYKWISIADLSKTGKYIRDTKEHLSKQAIDESGIKLIPANTVIMSFKLSIGKTAITAEDIIHLPRQDLPGVKNFCKSSTFCISSEVLPTIYQYF